MQIKTILPTALAVVAVSAQSNDTSSMNLTSLISSNSNLTGLATLLQSYPDVTASLANATNVTLFAPNNEALQEVQSVLASQQGDSSNFVQALLSYHVLSGMIYAENISTTPAFPHTMLNNSAYSNVTGGQVVECVVEGSTVEIISGLKSVANVTQANVNYTGGVVHIIDRVLTIPPGLAETAEAANLTALLGALGATNLTSTVAGLSDLTIFAPSNGAFQNIASAAGNLTTEQATQILEYHVINGTIAYSSSLRNTSIPTLGGGNVTITIENGTVFVNSARVVNPDILYSAGVIHVIDGVLNPNNTVAGNASESSPATAFSGASSGSQVPFTSGIPTPTTTIVELITSTTNVAADYSSVAPAGGSAASSGPIGSAGGSSSSSAGAAKITGAVGAAALFGGAAYLANM